MSDHPNKARTLVQAYLNDRQAKGGGRRVIVDEVGSGQDGWVFMIDPPLTALKVHESRRKFANELEAYRRLHAAGVNQIGDLNIPELVDYDEPRLIIEISYVQPPYLLDFGKVALSKPGEEPLDFHDFPEEYWQQWENEIVERFGFNANTVRWVWEQLGTRYGIWHNDPNKYNVNFGDEPDEP